MIDNIVLGDNQFIGVNHRSEMAGKEKAAYFQDVRNVIRTLEIAKENGAGGVMFSSVESIRDIVPEIIKNPRLKGFHIYPLIPYLMKYVDSLTRKGLSGTLASLTSGGRGIENVVRVVSTGIGGLRGDYTKVFEHLIDLEMALFRGGAVKAVVLHNGVVDLMLGLGFDELFRFYDGYIRKKYSAIPAYGTLNLPLLVQKLKKCGFENPLIMSPVNACGFNMHSSVEACERTIAEGGFEHLAMNVFSSGAVKPKEAFEYLSRLKHIKHVVLGASSEQHIKESFGLAKRQLNFS